MTDSAPGRPGPPPPARAPRVEVVDVIAAAVRAVPGVADLHTGAFGEVATYLPGRRVGGIRLLPGRCEVHVVISWGAPVEATAQAVRAAAAASFTGPVDVTIEDLVAPAEPATPELATPEPAGPGAGAGLVPDTAGSVPAVPSSALKERL